MARHCARCRVPEVEAQLSSCGRCRMKWYCSRACQKAHWKLGHKLYCVQVTAPLPANLHQQVQQALPSPPLVSACKGVEQHQRVLHSLEHLHEYAQQ